MLWTCIKTDIIVGEMQERNTDNNHICARTPSMILIPHELVVELAGI
jgi:hypothetical protein